MRILMCTNTYLPHVGGVANSVVAFSNEYKALGHEVMVIAPEFDDAPADETNVIRVPAIQKFNGSDFSACIPTPIIVKDSIETFAPEIVHSHHPFLLGTYAYRIATTLHVPLIFTHHTMYERYTHYVPGDCDLMKKYAIQLAVGYCNLCNGVVAPSQSVEALLRERGVTVPIEPIPTGVDMDAYGEHDGPAFRADHGIEDSTFVIGHVGRLAPEKNLEFLARAVCHFLKENSGLFLVVGDGPSFNTVQDIFEDAGMSDRLKMTGKLTGQDLINAYAAMDVFGFASKTETQGMVLLEAMAAGTPVVAVDAPGVRDVVTDTNGILLEEESLSEFISALKQLAEQPDRRQRLSQSAYQTAVENSKTVCATRALSFYGDVIQRYEPAPADDDEPLRDVLNLMEYEWRVWKTRTSSMIEAIGNSMSS